MADCNLIIALKHLSAGNQCFGWVVGDQWNDHCRGHLSSITSKRCGSIAPATYRRRGSRSPPISPKRKDRDFEQCECLSTEERPRFDDKIPAASDRLRTAGIQHEQLAALPIGQPDPISKKSWRRKNTHGKGKCSSPHRRGGCGSRSQGAGAPGQRINAQLHQNASSSSSSSSRRRRRRRGRRSPATPERGPPVPTTPARLAIGKPARAMVKKRRGRPSRQDYPRLGASMDLANPFS